MIRKILGFVPDEFAPLTPKLFAAIIAQALSQAVAYLLLLPLLEALFGDDLARAWVWALLMLVAVAAVAGFGYLQAAIGLRIAVGIQRGLQTRIGDHLNALPLGWFETHNAGPLSRIVVENVREIQGAIAYLLAKVLNRSASRSACCSSTGGSRWPCWSRRRRCCWSTARPTGRTPGPTRACTRPRPKPIRG